MFQYQSSYGVQQYKTYYSIPVMPTPCVTSSRRTGRVKFFNLSKGYGFIIPTFTDTEPNPSKQEEVFVHHTSILSANKGYLVGLNKGEEVEYDLCDGPKGIYALYVTGAKGLPIQFNPCHSGSCSNSTSSTTSSPTTLQPPPSKSVIAYPPLYQQPYITYIIPSLPTHTSSARETTKNNPSIYHQSSINNLIAYY
ncbi:unnamed protein product [Mucor hiemalis]